jgi:hypothetical protein
VGATSEKASFGDDRDPCVPPSDHRGMGKECPVWGGELPFNNRLKPGKDVGVNGDKGPRIGPSLDSGGGLECRRTRHPYPATVAPVCN